MPTPLIMGQSELLLLRGLAVRASLAPLHMPTLMDSIKTPEGKAAHMRNMDALTVEIPMGFLVTYSVETGHPAGTCRHMSISSPRKGAVPTPEAAQWVCEALGFVGNIMETCHVYLEDLARGHGVRAQAVNVIQPVSVAEAAHV